MWLDVLMKDDDGSDSAEEGILSDCLSDAAFAINGDNHNAEFFDFISIRVHLASATASLLRWPNLCSFN